MAATNLENCGQLIKWLIFVVVYFCGIMRRPIMMGRDCGNNVNVKKTVNSWLWYMAWFGCRSAIYDYVKFATIKNWWLFWLRRVQFFVFRSARWTWRGRLYKIVNRTRGGYHKLKKIRHKLLPTTFGQLMIVNGHWLINSVTIFMQTSAIICLAISMQTWPMDFVVVYMQTFATNCVMIRNGACQIYFYNNSHTRWN